VSWKVECSPLPLVAMLWACSSCGRSTCAAYSRSQNLSWLCGESSSGSFGRCRPSTRNQPSECAWWSPSHPFKSSLTGQSARQLAESYEYRIDLATKEAERLRIEADGLKAYQNILATSLTPDILKWEGIEATKELAKSPNAKMIIIGDKNGLPLVLGDK